MGTVFEKIDSPSEQSDTILQVENSQLVTPTMGQDPGLELTERALRKSVGGILLMS